MVGHMRELEYNVSTPVYAASGLLSYNDTNSKCSKHPWPMPLGAPHRELAGVAAHVSCALVPRRNRLCYHASLFAAVCACNFAVFSSGPRHLQPSGAPMHVWPRDQALPACAFLHMQACKLTPSSCAVKACAARWSSRRTTCRPTKWRVRARHPSSVLHTVTLADCRAVPRIASCGS